MTTTDTKPERARPTPPTTTSPGEPSAGLLPARPAAALLRPVRAHLVACGVLSALGAAAGAAPYIAIAEIARVMLSTPTAAAAAPIAWTWVGIGVVGALLRLVLLGASSYVGHYADAKLLHEIRTRVVDKLGVLPLGWIRAKGSGSVKKTMTDDLEEMHHLIAHALGELIGGVTALTVSFAYLLVTDWRMTLITAVVPVLMVLSYLVAMRSMTEHVGNLITAETRISAASVEYADGITVVKTFGGGGRILTRFATAVAEHTKALRTWVLETRYSTGLAHLFGSEVTVLAVVLAVGVWFVAGGALTAADLLPFLVVGVGLPTPLTPITRGAQGLRKARMAAGDIGALLGRPPLPEPEAPQMPDGHRVELDRVTFSYDGKTDAVHDVTATFEPGTVTALVGPSGAGKSTLASLLPRFADVTGGAVRIGGVDVRDMASEQLLASMALVFQDVILLRDTITDNIRVGRPGATDEQVRAAARAARVDEVVERLPHGYDTVLDGAGGGLSGGERQRLTIARALLADAPIVVLDEATAALDPDSEAAVQDALATLIEGRTVVVIAHRLHTVATADRIVVLDGGRVVETGDHPTLLAHDGLYRRMWAAQQNGDHS
ncbi:ABC transporter ATP-binding protein [Amycolatopsis sp. QT-25]|uniref:ABC transporter ATP-binding protein n=1 Tax=Amycolatopsis sp. QT-25 TaxID=3034022 RepID=UPI0023EC3E4B|nr:ABC transporter ATP-binding protein [Amycolatopsis sp. QT-25]WET76718.1 ABC transporter ATP-binding protein [Amycolatopsis sp. QT-25]